jgi:hypothetical protein
MNRILTEIIVDLLVFLEMSSDDIVDPDAAVQQIDTVAYHLRQLGKNDRDIIVGYIQEIAHADEFAERPDLQRFLSSLPESLGLQDEL